MDGLKELIKFLVVLTTEDQGALFSLFGEKKLKRKEYLTTLGEYSKGFAFVRNSEGAEYNKTFFTEGHFVGAYSSLFLVKKMKGIVFY